jgi:anthranilate phosphoribosyltransferase
VSAVAEALTALVRSRDLDEAVAERAVGALLDGECTPIQGAALLTALACKHETSAELAGAVRAIRGRQLPIDLSGPLLDTCGTGGDRLGTLNISTAAAFVVAAAGVNVAKHGNRAASGSVGAADVLEAAGVAVDLAPEECAVALARFGFCFLFAPRFHPALRALAPVRRELGFPTVFNLAAPLCNPAHATRQVLGVFDLERALTVAEALKLLGTERSLVVHGDDGADEILPTGPATILEIRSGSVERGRVDPLDLGIPRCRLEQLKGGDAAANARLLRAVLGGEPGPKSDAVALNAGAALYVADRCGSLGEGVARARDVLASAAALERLDAYGAWTQGLRA